MMIYLIKHFFDKQIINNKSWAFLPWLMIIGFLLRIFIIFVSEANFDSDEIFQYLEQAHRLTFGYGIIPWEYAHGIRNWFLPCLIALVLSACRLFGLDQLL
jgi:GPI mannosyltransferase 3